MKSILSFIPGFLLLLVWNASYYGSLNYYSYIIRPLLSIFSIIVFILFFRQNRTFQLFYSDKSISSRSTNLNSRVISSKRAFSISSWLGRLIRGSASAKNPQKWILGEVMELDKWIIVPWMQGIVIFFSPMVPTFSFMIKQKELIHISSAVIAIFLLFLFRRFVSSIEDEKILSEELYKTQNHIMHSKLEQYHQQEYMKRMVLRRKHYKNGLPEYGPGTDLKLYYKQQISDDESQNSSSRQSPVSKPWYLRS